MQFKCSSCGQKFDSAEEDYVRCPHCQSDNVAPFKPSKMNLVFAFLAMLMIAGITFFALRILLDSSKDTGTEMDTVGMTGTESSSADGSASGREVRDSVKVVIPPSVTLKVNEPNYKNGSYSFEASCMDLPAGMKVKYVLMEEFGDKVIKESANGKFVGVAPSAETGNYKLVLVNVESGETLDEKVLSGFVKVKVLKAKMPKSELQKLINGQDQSLMDIHPSIVHRPALKFTNLDAGEKCPKIFADIFQKFNMAQWESVDVISVGYNENNMINSVTMTIKHVEF